MCVCVHIVHIDRTANNSTKFVAENVDEKASKTDLLSLKDQISIQTQQLVATNISVWHDKHENNVTTILPLI